MLVMLLVFWERLLESLADFDRDGFTELFLEVLSRMLEIGLGEVRLLLLGLDLFLSLQFLLFLRLLNGRLDLILHGAEEIVLELREQHLLLVMFLMMMVLLVLAGQLMDWLCMLLLVLLMMDRNDGRLREALLNLIISLLDLLQYFVGFWFIIFLLARVLCFFALLGQ
jgi:hypothetical protein